jgi:hypothetical protein
VAHHELLLRSLTSAPERWQLTQTVPITRLLWEKGTLQVYQRLPQTAQ